MRFTRHFSLSLCVYFLNSLTVAFCQISEFPKSEFEYSQLRDDLISKEKDFTGISFQMTDDEIIVDNFLQHLKWTDFDKRRHFFLPSHPIEETLTNITSSPLFEVLKKMPKGGNMHLHENHWLPRGLILDIVLNTTELLPYFYVQAEGSNPTYSMDYFLNPPPNEGWVKFEGSKLTKDKILAKQQMTRTMTEHAKRYPSDSAERWRIINKLFPQVGGVLGHRTIREKYSEACLRFSLDEGVQYAESRSGLSKLYVLNTDQAYRSTHGKQYLDPVLTDPMKKGDAFVNLTASVLQDFIRREPRFIGVKRIVHASRRYGAARIRSEMTRALRHHTRNPDHVVGFDLVSEEDRGHSHLFYLADFVKLGGRLPLFMHTAETSWPDDLRSSLRYNADDIGATLQNTYEALLYGSRRVGHALGYAKHPYLLTKLRQRGVAVEACPVSNHILGYVPDLRQHPALGYLRAGVPVVFGADDPGTFGVDYFTVDWYLAHAGLGLRLPHLRRVADDSLRYSAMSAPERDAGRRKWRAMWADWVRDTRAQACSYSYDEPSGASFSRLLPRAGPADALVHVYGAGFSFAICRKPRCRFGNHSNMVTEARFVDTEQLTCRAAGAEIDGEAVSLPVSLPVYVDLGDGAWLHTEKTYTYTSGGASRLINYSYLHVIVWLLVYLCFIGM